MYLSLYIYIYNIYQRVSVSVSNAIGINKNIGDGSKQWIILWLDFEF